MNRMTESEIEGMAIEKLEELGYLGYIGYGLTDWD